MTDEKLIEEAAKAIIEVKYPDIGWGTLSESAREPYRKQARAAFAVFEKAYAKELDTSTEPVKNGADSLHVAPTDDERAMAEALAVLESHEQGEDDRLERIFRAGNILRAALEQKGGRP